jgi:hypothetical protein
MSLASLTFLTLLFSATQSGSSLSTTLTGRITDADGCPIAGATVRAHDAKGALLGEGVTTSEGKFVVERLPGGIVEVAAEMSGFLRSEARLVVSSRLKVWDTSLALARLADMPARRVSGVVTASDKVPLSGVSITVVTAFGTRIVSRAHTDEKGRFSVALDEGGQYVVIAAHVGFRGSSELVSMGVSSPSAEVRFVLSKGSSCQAP